MTGRPHTDQLLLRVLRGEASAPPPVWFMRQAGRYLPEYRELRKRAGSFLDLCYDPDLACEVSLQPIDRFDLDAAILFADILLIPHALGQELSFVEGEGPRLQPVASSDLVLRYQDADIDQVLAPIYETVRQVRKRLAPEKALIGFAGAPWTVATYMLAGGPVKDPSALRRYYYREREFLTGLLDLLTARTVHYLSRQVEAGADVVQLFDSWAGGLPPLILEAVSIRPMEEIARRLKERHPGVPVIMFPKDVGAQATRYAALDVCDAVAIDTSTPWDWARAHLSPGAVVQGGLDPLLVVAGGEAMGNAARNLIADFSGAPYIFNLGHGFTPETPPENVAELVDVIRES